MAISDFRHTDTERERLETQEWLESLDYVIKTGGPERVRLLLRQLQKLPDQPQAVVVAVPRLQTTARFLLILLRSPRKSSRKKS